MSNAGYETKESDYGFHGGYHFSTNADITKSLLQGTEMCSDWNLQSGYRRSWWNQGRKCGQASLGTMIGTGMWLWADVICAALQFCAVSSSHHCICLLTGSLPHSENMWSSVVSFISDLYCLPIQGRAPNRFLGTECDCPKHGQVAKGLWLRNTK